jgi:penicillin-binding protein 2
MAKNYTRKDIGFDETVADSAFSGLDSKEQPLRRRIFLGLFATISLLTLIAAGRLLTIGTAEHGHYAARAASNANAETSVIAPRGIISDRYGKPLVENRPIFSVFLRVDKMIQQSEEDKVLDATQNVLALDRNQIVTEIAATNFEEGNDILLKRDITREQVIAVQSLNLSSLRVENDYKRRYLGEAFSHLVGFVGQSDKDRLVKGRTGLEAYYDDRLRGEDGKRILPRNARGQVQGPETVTSPVPGQNLATTVDSELQEYFYRRMASGLQSLGRTSGVGLALNPKNGEVLALLSFPAFDPANVAAALKSENQPLFNRAVSGSYNPGSTIKPVHAVAALKEGVIVPDKEILSTGYIEIPNPYDPEHPSRFLDWKPQGWVDLY